MDHGLRVAKRWKWEKPQQPTAGATKPTLARATANIELDIGNACPEDDIQRRWEVYAECAAGTDAPSGCYENYNWQDPSASHMNKRSSSHSKGGIGADDPHVIVEVRGERKWATILKQARKSQEGKWQVELPDKSVITRSLAEMKVLKQQQQQKKEKKIK